MAVIDADEGRRLCADLLERLGTPADVAVQVAGWLVRADLAGHASHGIAKVVDYAGRIQRGTLVPTGRPTVVSGETSGQAVLVDGGGGFGHLAAHRLTSILVDRLTDHPIVIGGIINASHTGRLGEWAEQAAQRGAVMLMFTASVERGGVAAYGAREPRLGTNPLAVGVPASGDDAMILDFATSRIAGAKAHHYRSAGEPAPADSLLDRDGNPTTDPAALEDGGMLLTFGEHKGYGLSLLVSLLAGCIVGSAGRDASQQGVLAIAFNPDTFASREVVSRSIQSQLERMRSTPPRSGFDRVEIPGDYERSCLASANGSLSIPDATWEGITTLAQRLGAVVETTPRRST